MSEMKGQSTLELTAALVVIAILLIGTAKIFLWINDSMVRRQVNYEATRVAAGSAEFGAVTLAPMDNVEANATSFNELMIDESNYPKLNIFGQ
jgi:hypothetical protein